jgi:multicomponent Na+:H+ antiporter subunit E
MLVLFFIFWLVLNGRITAEILVIGAALTVLLYLFARLAFGYTWRTELTLMKLVPLTFVYLIVLAWAILRANMTVMRLVWFKRVPIDPAVVKVNVPFDTDVARAVLANSISITPGTITASVEGDTFYVHCLSPKMIEGIGDSMFVRLLRRMEAYR